MLTKAKHKDIRNYYEDTRRHRSGHNKLLILCCMCGEKSTQWYYCSTAESGSGKKRNRNHKNKQFSLNEMKVSKFFRTHCRGYHQPTQIQRLHRYPFFLPLSVISFHFLNSNDSILSFLVLLLSFVSLFLFIVCITTDDVEGDQCGDSERGGREEEYWNKNKSFWDWGESKQSTWAHHDIIFCRTTSFDVSPMDTTEKRAESSERVERKKPYANFIFLISPSLHSIEGGMKMMIIFEIFDIVFSLWNLFSWFF